MYDNIKFSNWTNLSCVTYKNSHIPDFLSEEQLLMGFRISWPVFQNSNPRIHDSRTNDCPDSAFHEQKFPGLWISGFPHMRRHSRGNKTDIKTRMLAWMLDINRLTWVSFDFASFSSLMFAFSAIFWYMSHSCSFRSRYCLFPCIWIAEGLHSSAIIFLARNQKAQHGSNIEKWRGSVLCAALIMIMIMKECFVIYNIKFCVW